MAAKLIGERLPPDWSYGVTRDGRIFFIDDRARITTWLHPRTGQPVQTGNHSVPGLPPGWEQALTVEGAAYFINHGDQFTTFEHPVTGRPVTMDTPRSPPASPTSPTSPTGKHARKSSAKSKNYKGPPASRGENSKIIMRGWLQKQEGGGLKLWKRKWCVLADYGLFFYKDDSEQTPSGSLLLPSYSISVCPLSEVNKKFAFKAEHENMKTGFFSADNQNHMEQWVGALRMAALVQRAPGSTDIPKLIPKSPIMTWTDDPNSPGLSPPDMQQQPFTRPAMSPSQYDDRLSDRSPLQSRENTQNFKNQNPQSVPYDEQRSIPNDSIHGYDPRGQPRDVRSSYPSHSDGQGSARGSDKGSHAYNPSGDYGTLSYEHGYPQVLPGQGHERLTGYPGPGLDTSRMSGAEQSFSSQGQPALDNSFNRQNISNYPGNRDDRNRTSQRSQSSNQGQQRLPDDQRSRSSTGVSSTASRPRSDQGQYSSHTLPRSQHDNRGQPSQSSLRPSQLSDQGHRTLPREQRLRPGHFHGTEGPDSHSSPRGTLERREGKDGRPARREEHNPYMLMTSPDSHSSRVISPQKHSNRPLPQEPPRQLVPNGAQASGGDYASLTRFRDKQTKSRVDTGGPAGMTASTSPGGVVSPSHQRPDLYVDLPHTYVNVYDESQVRDAALELPERPPLPAEMRQQLVEDIAESHTPTTQRQLMAAERNLETRMQQPPFFNYPTPTRESLPAFPQESPRSQRSEQSQRSDPRSRHADTGIHKGRQPTRPDLASSPGRVATEIPIVRHDAGETYSTHPHINDNYLNGSDNTLTNDDDRRDQVGELKQGFYGLGRYNEKAKSLGRYQSDLSSDRNQRFLSDMDVRAQTLPSNSKPRPGITGEKDFRLRSLPDHAQSMPSIFHEQPLTVQVPDRQPMTNSFGNLGTSGVSPPDTKLLLRSDFDDPSQRKSAFRPLSGAKGSDSLQRISTGSDSSPRKGDKAMPTYHDPGQSGGLPNSQGYYDAEQTEVKQVPPAGSQQTQPRGQQWKSDNFPSQLRPDGGTPRGQGQGRGQGHGRGQRAPPIETVKEDPNMPDSDVIETELPMKVFPLNGPRLRMSISAGDLLGKTHDELVLLLIQLRRDKAELTEQRDGLRKGIDQTRPTVLRYRKIQADGGHIDADMEAEYREYADLKPRCEELEKKLEVYKPLVNLVCNMVTMGSLYGGDNFMLATEYRKHLLSPEQYSPPKKMLEFSRQHQEDQIVQDIEDNILQLTRDEADLEEKQNRLYLLDRINQEQSFQVTSLKEDRELLEKAQGGLVKKQEQGSVGPREMEQLVHKQRTIERELSRVLQQLAEASKELEETTAEMNKVEHEVALLRSKVHGDMSRSKSAPSLSSESLRTKMKMEKDLVQVQNIMEGLSKEGQRLQAAMSTLRQSTLGATDKVPGADSQGKKSSSLTYYETDVDTSDTKDLAKVTKLLESYQLGPGQADEDLSPEPANYQPLTSEMADRYRSQPISNEQGTSAFTAVTPSNEQMDGENQWDIGDADDNTKKYFGLIPKNMPKSQTLRDVKRNLEHRREEKKKEDDPPLRISVISSDYTDSNFPVYENLPQPKTSTELESKPWSSVLSDANGYDGSQRRRSNLHLMMPKPFVASHGDNNSETSSPYTSQSVSFKPFKQTRQSETNIPFNQSNNISLDQSNERTGYTGQSEAVSHSEPDVSSFARKTPPPPPTRGTSKLITAEVAQQHSILPTSMMTFMSHDQGEGNSTSLRNFEKPFPSILAKKSPRSGKKSRYLTISSSQPIKLEQKDQQSPKLHSQAGDLITSMDIPDIVKSSTTKMEQFDERTFEREILFFPEKVEIPERYMPDSDEETLTEEDREIRREKAEKIKKILTQQSVHSLSQPDVSKVAGEVHERVLAEKQKRSQLLGIGHELAEQVKLKSRQFAADRRKTWSGPTSKSEEEANVVIDDGRLDNSHLNNSDTNNNDSFFGASYPSMDNTEPYTSGGFGYKTSVDAYTHNGYHDDEQTYSKQYTEGAGMQHTGEDNSYMASSYQGSPYMSKPNFKI